MATISAAGGCKTLKGLCRVPRIAPPSMPWRNIGDIAAIAFVLTGWLRFMFDLRTGLSLLRQRPQFAAWELRCRIVQAGLLVAL